MATTTPNFGWSVPTSSDLVKNGATAIETLGDAIDASLVDLKGGTTGQVLSKTSNTDMDFTWSAAASVPDSYGFTAGKNAIINGDFRVNQRAFTSSTTQGYGFDRWRSTTSGGTVTYSAQTFTAGTAPVAGYEGINFARMLTASQSAASDYAIFLQPMEDCRLFAGQTITVSFWAKAASGTPKVAVEFVQNFGSGGSADVNTYAGQVILSTSWARYSVTGTVPSIAGKTIGASSSLSAYLWSSAGSTYNSRTGSIGIQNNTVDYWGVQVEAGSTATAFQTATGSIQGELAACQRYYYRLSSPSSGFKLVTAGQFYLTTAASTPLPFPVTMRAVPTAFDTTATAADYGLLGAGGGTNTMSVLPTAGNYTRNSADITGTIAAGGVAGNGTILFFNGSAAYLGFSAEL